MQLFTATFVKDKCKILTILLQQKLPYLWHNKAFLKYSRKNEKSMLQKTLKSLIASSVVHKT